MHSIPKGQLLVKLFTFVVVLRCTAGYSGGAPGGACADLTPSHGGTAQTSASPYTITFSPSTFTAGGSAITVTLSTTTGTAFKGFLLTTQYEDPCVDQSLKPGTFAAIANTQLICTNAGVTHTQVNTQNSLSFQWTPPATSQGHIRFRATFVQDKLTYWVDVKASNALTDSAVGSTTYPTTCSNPAPSPTGTLTKDTECGKTKGCYSDCDGTECGFLMTWSQGSSASNVLITMMSQMGSAQNRYISFGLSRDSKMGDDSVVFCTSAADGIYSYINVGEQSNPLANTKQGLTADSNTFQDGILTCSFYRDIAEASNGEFFTANDTYTFLWAVGPGSSGSFARHDSSPIVSTSTASLQDFTADIVGGVEYLLVKAHGTLMMIGWIFLASIGLVYARYFKDLWAEKKLFGQKIWFQVHRATMVLCLLMTVIAFILIFVFADGYSHIHGEGYQNSHPVLGIIVTILTVVNPVMALFRPQPGTSNRVIFNWLHWGVGMLAYILAVITVFFGITLEKSGAPDYMIYILVVFVVWQIAIQIVLEVLQCKGRNSDGQDRYELTNASTGDMAVNKSSEEQSSFIKRVLMVVHVVVISAFTITLIIVLNVKEDDD